MLGDEVSSVRAPRPRRGVLPLLSNLPVPSVPFCRSAHCSELAVSLHLRIPSTRSPKLVMGQQAGWGPTRPPFGPSNGNALLQPGARPPTCALFPTSHSPDRQTPLVNSPSAQDALPGVGTTARGHRHQCRTLHGAGRAAGPTQDRGADYRDRCRLRPASRRYGTGRWALLGPAVIRHSREVVARHDATSEPVARTNGDLGRLPVLGPV